jgi:hypothetical protein
MPGTVRSHPSQRPRLDGVVFLFPAAGAGSTPASLPDDHAARKSPTSKAIRNFPQKTVNGREWDPEIRTRHGGTSGIRFSSRPFRFDPPGERIAKKQFPFHPSRLFSITPV